MQEGIEIIVPGATFRISTGSMEIVIDGKTFLPDPVVISVTEHRELLISLAADHPFSRRYIVGGVPRKQTQVNLFRIDEHGKLIHSWRGKLTSADFDGSQVRFRVVSLLAHALQRRIPAVVVSRLCQHRLYDVGCRVDRTAFTRPAKIVSIEGYNVTIDSALDEQWARGGELVHLSTGERVEILEQVSGGEVASVIRLQAQLYEARIGDAVEVSAGCDRDIVMCREKFNNVVNYGGFPHLPTKNPFDR